MHTLRRLTLAVGFGLVIMQAAADAPNENNSMPDRAELEAALDECASSVGLDSNGRPDHSAMDSCMSAKGFSKPSGGPPGHGAHGPRGDNPPERPE
jgi:hypothetical protein